MLFALSISFFGLLQKKQTVNAYNKILEYVSLGDSIAAGYGLDGYNQEDELNENTIISTSYAGRFKTYLENRYGEVYARSFGVAGAYTGSLIEMLTSTTNQEYIKVKQYVQTADIITICIGANDILGPAGDALLNANFLQNQGSMFDFDLIQTNMQQGLDSFSDSNHFPALLNILNDLVKPTSKVIFLDVYNPYHSFINTEIDAAITLSVTPELYPFLGMVNFNNTIVFSHEDLGKIGYLAGCYLSGGLNLNAEQVKGLNERMYENVYATNNLGERIYPNFYMVEGANGAGYEYLNGIKATFEDYTDGNGYDDLVFESLLSYTTSNPYVTQTVVGVDDIAGMLDGSSQKYSQLEDEFLLLVDPHPTTIGHQQINTKLVQCYTSGIDEFDLCYEITFDAGEGSGTMQTIYTDENDRFTLPICSFTSPANKQFKCWSVFGVEYNPGQTITVNEDAIVIAIWEDIAQPQNNYTVTFNAGEGSGTMEPIYSDSNDIITLPQCTFTAPNGKLFKCWYYNGIEYNPGQTLHINSNITIIALWLEDGAIEEKYVVTFDFGDWGNSYSIEVTVNTLVQQPEVSRDHYMISRWEYRNDDGIMTEWNFGLNSVTRNVTLKAVWVRLYTVTFDKNCDIDYEISNLEVIQGSKIEEPQGLVYPNHKLVYWTYIGADSQEHIWDFDVNTVTFDLNLIANWKVIYIITFDSNGGSYAEPVMVAEGEKVTAPKNITNEGCVLIGWTLNDQEEDIEYWDFEQDEVSSSILLKAIWSTIVCLNEQNAQQVLTILAEVNGFDPIQFQLTVPTNSIQWYVNMQAQEGENSATFNFVPPAQTGTYEVYCIINGLSTYKYLVTIKYGVMNEITINKQNIYTNGDVELVVEHPELYDPQKVQWFAIETNDDGEEKSVSIGYGASIIHNFDKSCKVYATYAQETQLTSNFVDVEIDLKIDPSMPIFIGVAGVIFLGIAVLAIFSRRRYDKI